MQAAARDARLSSRTEAARQEGSRQAISSFPAFFGACSFAVSPLLLAAVLGAAGCALPNDDPTSVHDLRILAIGTTPPELRYPVHGNFAQSQCAPDLSPIYAAAPIRIGTLVADPDGGGRDLPWTFTECPQTGTEQCPPDPAYVIAQGDSPASAIGTTWDIAAEAAAETRAQQSCAGSDGGCPPTPLLTAFAANTAGLCRFGVWLQIGLMIAAPERTIYGSKILVFTPMPDDYPTDAGVCPQAPDGGMPDHENPEYSVLQLDGQTLPASSVETASAGAPHQLQPVIPTLNGPSDYCVPNFEGGWTRLHETWLFSFMTTIGTFSQEQVGYGGWGNPSGGPITYSIDWNNPADGGVATIYSVLRDGRGGTSWITRQVDLVP